MHTLLNTSVHTCHVVLSVEAPAVCGSSHHCTNPSADHIVSMSHAHHRFLKQRVCLQLVGVFCKGLLPGLLPLVWSIALLKASKPFFMLC